MHVYIPTMSAPQRCQRFSRGQYTLLQVLAHHPGWGRILNETESRAFVVKVVQTTDPTTEETVPASAGRDKVPKMSTCPTNCSKVGSSTVHVLGSRFSADCCTSRPGRREVLVEKMVDVEHVDGGIRSYIVPEGVPVELLQAPCCRFSASADYM